MAEVLTDRQDLARFELALGEQVAFIRYQRRDGVLLLTHAEVPPELAGQGIGSRLTAAVLDQVRARGVRVVARCPFIAAFIDRNPAYRDLLA